MLSRWPTSRMFLALLLESLNQNVTDPQLQRDWQSCSDDLTRVIEDAQNQKSYAVQMFDSWAKPEGGIMEGNVGWRGHYYECLDAKNKTTPIYGRWCMSTMGYTSLPYVYGYPMAATIGTCFPTSCSEKSVETILRSFYANLTNSPLLSVSCPVLDQTFGHMEILGMLVTLIFLLLGLVATVADLYWQHYKTTAQEDVLKPTRPILPRLAECFSFVSNGKNILSTRRLPGMIPVLDGMRVISTTWVIMFHVFFVLPYASDNSVRAAKNIRGDASLMAMVNGIFCVDTFFVIGGMLVAYLGMKRMHKYKGRLNVPIYYLQRYLRLTPVYAYVILISMGLYKYLGDGPEWPTSSDDFYDQCHDDWWANLLYFSNLYPLVPDCFQWCWYLANDMQFYLLSPIFLFVLYKSKLWGHVLLVAGTLGSILTSALLTYFAAVQPDAVVISLNLNLARRFSNPNAGIPDSFPVKYQTDTYRTPWCRISVYLIGMMAGYFLFEHKMRLKMNKMLVFFGWLTSAAVACTIVYALYPSVQVSEPLTIEAAVMWGTFSRPVWALCIVWVIVACVTGYGGPVKAFLDWSAFAPLSRLTYSAYIIHLVVISWYFGVQEQLFHYSYINTMFIYFGVVFVTFVCSFYTTLLIEWPITGLVKILFSANQVSKTEEETAPPNDVEITIQNNQKNNDSKLKTISGSTNDGFDDTESQSAAL